MQASESIHESKQLTIKQGSTPDNRKGLDQTNSLQL